MAGRGRPRGRDSKIRSDSGTVRKTYVMKYDQTGKTIKENPALKGFWSNHKVEDMMSISGEELDKLIDEWLIKYQERQLARNLFWWYPEMGKLTLSEVRNKKTDLDKGY